MSISMDCPICMDCIENTVKNCVTTECGHSFHTNCLMQSVAHNGFGCPYCRAVMAEHPKEDEDSDWDDDDEYRGAVWHEEVEVELELFSDDALRGFRFFWNMLNGLEHDEDDDADEQQLEDWEQVRNTIQPLPDTNIPTTEFVAQKLRDQGITYEQLVKIICYNDHEEFEDDQSAESIDNNVFGKIRIIISNYRPEVQPATPVPEPEPEPEPLEVDFTAQPKTLPVRNIPTLNIHV